MAIEQSYSVNTVLKLERSKSGGTKTLSVELTDGGDQPVILAIVAADGECNYKGEDWRKAKELYATL